MHKKEKNLLRKIFELDIFVVTNVNEENIDKILLAYQRFGADLRKIVEKNKPEALGLVWERFSTMTEDEIRREFSNTKKYPDLDSIKLAVKGYVSMREVSKVKTRETLIKHIIKTYRRGEFISKIGKEVKERNEPKK